jgi:hypothetical protein
MSAVSDHIQLMKSQEKKYDSVFNKREWLYINDTVSQYDQGTSIIETTSLSNNSKFLDYNSAYLSVPLLITLTSNDASPSGVTTGMPYNKAVSFKQSFLSMINSITVDLNGQSMIQQNQLIDVYNHFRLLTSEVGLLKTDGAPLDFILTCLRLVVFLVLTVNSLLRIELPITQI